ncbi:unnamed protein product [Pedinophyceae sp. YPF-701]|nr:unnamed protein product [Pedinophyceae sp. YPF-701]
MHDDDRTRDQLPSFRKVDPGSRAYTMDEVRKHATKDDAWIVVHNKVYNITDFILHHPGWKHGGQASTIQSILGGLGRDCTDDFVAIHSPNAWRQLPDYYIGDLIQDSTAPAGG